MGGQPAPAPVTMLKLGCARVSSDEQESHPKRDALAALGVAPERIYVAHGVTGTNQHRPGSSAVAAQIVPAIRRPARPNARARLPTKDQPGCPQEASLGQRGAPRVGVPCPSPVRPLPRRSRPNESTERRPTPTSCRARSRHLFVWRARGSLIPSGPRRRQANLNGATARPRTRSSPRAYRDGGDGVPGPARAGQAG